MIKHIATGSEGITKHDVSSPRAKRPSPINCVLATFELGKPTIALSISPYISYIEAQTAGDSQQRTRQQQTAFERRIALLGLGVHQKLLTFRALTYSPLNRSIMKSLSYNYTHIT